MAKTMLRAWNIHYCFVQFFVKIHNISIDCALSVWRTKMAHDSTDFPSLGAQHIRYAKLCERQHIIVPTPRWDVDWHVFYLSFETIIASGGGGNGLFSFFKRRPPNAHFMLPKYSISFQNIQIYKQREWAANCCPPPVAIWVFALHNQSCAKYDFESRMCENPKMCA